VVFLGGKGLTSVPTSNTIFRVHSAKPNTRTKSSRQHSTQLFFTKMVLSFFRTFFRQRAHRKVMSQMARALEKQDKMIASGINMKAASKRASRCTLQPDFLLLPRAH
jgi:preprotein translocase subunit YajC